MRRVAFVARPAPPVVTMGGEVPEQLTLAFVGEAGDQVLSLP